MLKENSLRKMFEDFLSLRLKGFQKLCAQTVTFSVFKNILSEWENYVMTTLDCARSIFGKLSFMADTELYLQSRTREFASGIGQSF